MGFTLSSILFGISPLDGSFHATMLHAAGTEVTKAGAQSVLVESVRDSSSVVLQGATRTELRLIRGEGDEQTNMRLGSPRSGLFTLHTSHSSTPALSIDTGPNVTDVVRACARAFSILDPWTVGPYCWLAITSLFWLDA